ncbi:ARF GTPase-activating protein GIT1 isoform X2 [Octopus sinensis]|uniref:ARF GTPase-activating protein GIT1 isoform X2 n=1 Tax=Octopus sinensis TaxID=2607531 RepID=A0A6P7TMZ7_9MOLL|nr:ARF GTPase-activating protein GIT1 isoform X2 [Octopus sinensis]
MSRGNIRITAEVCADCSAPDPTWASVNRGVLICQECCSVHRSLGRHISQVKHLKKAQWNPSRLAMVRHLFSSGANNIWEHSLLDPSQNKHCKKKPHPNDPVHPNKDHYIRTKYQFLSFVNQGKDGDVSTVEDLSKQLHSSVRTSNLETCLRLLSKGADPNYFNPEKNNCPLHVAAAAGQTSQVELLVVYGADPGCLDANRKTPIDYAREEKYTDLANRLIECQYELTDRLTYFVCRRKPDHRSNHHFIIPEMADSSLDISELAKEAKKMLQALPNNLFEELAMDVYDEVDRRENDEIWVSSNEHSSTIGVTIPFLPVNPEFSTTRNQGRQKLARFNPREFVTLIIDILSDAKRRQMGTTASMIINPKEPSGRSSAIMTAPTRGSRGYSQVSSDDEPLYDSVASDEDYSSIDTQSIKSAKEEGKKDRPADSRIIRREMTPTSIVSFTESMTSEQVEGPVSTEDFLEMKKSLANSECRVQQLLQTQSDLITEVNRLKTLVNSLVEENSLLKQDKSSGGGIGGGSRGSGGSHNNNNNINNNNINNNLPAGGFLLNGAGGGGVGGGGGGSVGGAGLRLSASSSPADLKRMPGSARPRSMFEPRNYQRQAEHKMSKGKDDLPTAQSVSNIHTGEEQLGGKNFSGTPSPARSETACAGEECDYDNASCASNSRKNSQCDSHKSSLQSISEAVPLRSPSVVYEEVGADVQGLPTQDEVVKKTERITRKIQELLQSAQEGKFESFAPCSDKIYSAVIDMASLFPKRLQKAENIQYALTLLTSSATQLAEYCQICSPGQDHGPSANRQAKTQQVIKSAYEIAKAAKQLVTLFQ